MIMACSLVTAGLLGSVNKVETSGILTNRCVMPDIAEWCRQGETIGTVHLPSQIGRHMGN